jgi:hypothetical protein
MQAESNKCKLSEYLIIKNCMAGKSLYQNFYYHSKYLNSMKR